MLQEKVLEFIKQHNLIQANDKIIIGVSGGPDSMCLLDILYNLKKQLNISIIVGHVNHMIREKAKEETAYVEEYCKKINVPCFTKYAPVEKMAKEQKVGTEEMGRNIRYQFFEEIAVKEGANKIATAHNANDNVETVLLNILRGTAISGLKGIDILRQGNLIANKKLENEIPTKVTYIRPLRNSTRQEIEEYCENKKLNPKIDESNLENIYTRNKVRNNLIPYLQKEFNSNIIEGVNRLSELARSDEEYFSKIVQAEYESLKIGENEKEIILDLKGFNQLDKVIKARLLLYTINKINGSAQGIAKVHIEDVIRLCQNNIGNKYLTPNKYIKVFVQKGKVFISSHSSK